MSTTPRQAPPLFSPAPAPRGRNLTALWLLLLSAVCALALGLQIRHFWPYLTDDAYISLRYSQRLLEGHGLTWNNLPPAVEGYTNLLWVLLCAGLGALGMNLVTAAHLLGITTTAIGIAAVAAQAYRDFPAKVKFVSALAGCLALSLSAPVAVWAIGGLEQPLLAALLGWAAYFAVRWTASAKGRPRDADAMGVLLGLALLARADAALFTALFYAGAVLADGVRVRTLLMRARMLPIPILFFLGQEIFRRFYYGAWLPNTAYVKVAFTLHRLRTGAHYEALGVRSELVFLALALVGCAALWIAGKKRQVILLATVCAGWLLYILIIGGDIFPAYRHFVPAMALMGFLISGCGLLTLSAPFRFSRVRLALLLIMLSLVLTSDWIAPLESWEWQGKSIGIFLRTAFGAEHPLLSSDAAGAVPYFAQMEAIDPLGLNDYHIARAPLADRGQGWVGHELGDGRYVLDHKPDLVLLADYQGDGGLEADRQMLSDPRFAADYQFVRIDAGPPYPVRAGMYIRRIDGKLGITEGRDRVTVPAYLATVNDANAVQLVDGAAELAIAPHSSAQFAAVPLRGGVWKASLEGAGAAQLKIADSIRPDARGLATVTVTNAGDRPAVLRRVELTRSGS